MKSNIPMKTTIKKEKQLWRPKNFWDNIFGPPAPTPKSTQKYYPSWAESRFKSDPNILQFSNETRPERFPRIFNSVKELYSKPSRVCSFGCSKGLECEALLKRFPDAEIIGVDQDHYSIQEARRNNKAPNVFFHEHLGGLGNFDVIFCLMVLFCLEKPIDKERFIKTIKELDAHLNPGGVIALYTLEYDPSEVLSLDKYEHLNVWNRFHNKHPDGKEYWNGYLRKKSRITILE